MALMLVGNMELEESLQRQIAAQTWGRIRCLQVRVAGDRVKVHGESPSYYLKQRALQAIRQVLEDAPMELDMEIEVGTVLKQERFRQQPLPDIVARVAGQ